MQSTVFVPMQHEPLETESKSWRNKEKRPRKLPSLTDRLPTIDIQSVEKGTANLPCDISLPEPHDPTDDVMLVLWYREDLGRPIYSVDSRDRPFNEAERWSDENVFGNRAYFRLSSRPAILAIENVVEGDAAVYRCRVDFRLAQTRNVKVNLTVIAQETNSTSSSSSSNKSISTFSFLLLVVVQDEDENSNFGLLLK
ncbi:hypothetical protein Fcan01_05853 [Folsomia candida]|uniref:Ig-like domain-containing protein n=1 Tax=Folsomia candida TaxID=158441 RepID=A0A226EUE1_FOLCA|nr:hypothetical protein Fcan01_05853 [Folsomia candida]